MHTLGPRIQPEGASPQGGLLAKGGEQEGDQLTSLTSQFAYTYKFRSLKGATEYHTEHQDGEEKDEDKGKGSKRAAVVNSMLLPGLCKGSGHYCTVVRTCRPPVRGVVQVDPVGRCCTAVLYKYYCTREHHYIPLGCHSRSVHLFSDGITRLTADFTPPRSILPSFLSLALGRDMT